jgi:hypothetical protein
MAFAGKIGQTLEGIHQFGLNPISDCQPRLTK